MAKRHSDNPGHKEQLNRRRYLQLGGTAAGVTALGSVGATSAVAADSGAVDDVAKADESSDDDNADHDELTNVLLIDSTVSDELAQYRIVVSGRIEQSDSLSSVVDGGSPWDEIQDRVDGSTATGVVARGIDGYRYSGELVSVQLDGNVDITLEEAD